MSSDYLSQRALNGLSRLGDLLIPGGYGMPSFSQTGCIAHVDVILAATDPADVRDLKRLLTCLSFSPDVLLRGLLKVLDKSESVPDFLGALLRLLNVGLKGVIFSLYYSDLQGDFVNAPSVHEAIGYSVQCEPDRAA